jgi:hypothetical protein
MVEKKELVNLERNVCSDEIPAACCASHFKTFECAATASRHAGNSHCFLLHKRSESGHEKLYLRIDADSGAGCVCAGSELQHNKALQSFCCPFTVIACSDCFRSARIMSITISLKVIDIGLGCVTVRRRRNSVVPHAGRGISYLYFEGYQLTATRMTSGFELAPLKKTRNRKARTEVSGHLFRSLLQSCNTL